MCRPFGCDVPSCIVGLHFSGGVNLSVTAHTQSNHSDDSLSECDFSFTQPHRIPFNALHLHQGERGIALRQTHFSVRDLD